MDHKSQRTSLEIKFDVCVFLLFGAVVVRATLDSACWSEIAITSTQRCDCLHLDVAQLELCRRVLVRDDDAQRDQHAQSKGHGGEEAEYILYPHERRVHLESV